MWHKIKEYTRKRNILSTYPNYLKLNFLSITYNFISIVGYSIINNKLNCNLGIIKYCYNLFNALSTLENIIFC